MIEYFRRLRRKRELARISAALEDHFASYFADASTATPPSHVHPPTDVLGELAAWMNAYPTMPRPAWDVAEKGPIRLTRLQIDCMKVAAPSPSPLYGGLVGALYGLPIVEVATTEESTPYTEGWIKP